MNLKSFISYLIIVSLVVACSDTYTIKSYDTKMIEIQSSVDSSILEIITPYQNKIKDQMNEIISYSKNNLDKGRPQSTLGNFVADLCLKYADADLCVMNNGGLRATISKGNITRGKIYELMPFENELVILKLNRDDYLELINYIVKRGGEPFSGIKIIINNDKEIVNYSLPVDFENGEYARVLTSDYLANGGDAMSFFTDKQQKKTGKKLRDVIIDYCINTDSIDIQLDDRIKIISNE